MVRRKKEITEQDIEITNPDAINFMRIGKKTFILKPIEVDPLKFKESIEQYYNQKAERLAHHVVDIDFNSHLDMINRVHNHILKRVNESKCVVPEELQNNGQILMVYNKRVHRLKSLYYNPQFFKTNINMLVRNGVELDGIYQEYTSTPGVNPEEMFTVQVEPSLVNKLVHYAYNSQIDKIYCFGQTFHTMAGNPNYLCTGNVSASVMFSQLDDSIVRNSVNCFSLATDNVYDIPIKDFLSSERVIKIIKMGDTQWKI